MSGRSVTDGEIGLIRAMLARGMKNRDIQFFFNRRDRPVNSGRITQIRKGTYGPEIPRATESDLDAFLVQFERAAANGETKGASSLSPSIRANAHFEKRGRSWFLKTHETDQAECKQAFGMRPDNRIAAALRAIAGLANNSGGFLFFGVQELDDKSLKVAGLPDPATFSQLDPAEMNRVLASALAPVPNFLLGTIAIDGMTVGFIEVAKHLDGPIIALKNIGNELKEGAIYYRYVGETRLIKPSELRQIINERERRAVESFAQAMTRFANGSVATLDLDSGHVNGPKASFTIDEALLKNIQFIREGEFQESRGKPTLRLVGNVTAIENQSSTRTQIVPQNITDDVVIRTFLERKPLSDPLPYILALVNSSREWLPLWYFVQQSEKPLSQIIESLRAEHSSQPTHRNYAIARLLRSRSAYKQHTGTPQRLLAEFDGEEVREPKGDKEDGAFALAVQGLPDGFRQPERLRLPLLNCFNRAQGSDTKSQNRRSSIYRAACRLDELIHRPPAPRK